MPTADDGRSWDEVRFNAFPSREAFMAVSLDPERLAAQAENRETAIADTYTMILRLFIDRLTESLTGCVHLPTPGSGEAHEHLLDLADRVAVGGRLLGVGDAVGEAGAHESEPDLFECPVGRRDLGDDVAALAALVEHPLDALHLAGYPTQALAQVVGDLLGQFHLGLLEHSSRGRFRQAIPPRVSFVGTASVARPATSRPS
jgi:hypothetical protein